MTSPKTEEKIIDFLPYLERFETNRFFNGIEVFLVPRCKNLYITNHQKGWPLWFLEKLRNQKIKIIIDEIEIKNPDVAYVDRNLFLIVIRILKIPSKVSIILGEKMKRFEFQEEEKKRIEEKYIDYL